MKEEGKGKGLLVSVVILFLLLVISIGAGFYFYTEQARKFENFTQDYKFTKKKMVNMQKAMDNFLTELSTFNSTLNVLHRQSGKYSKDLYAMTGDLYAMKERLKINQVNKEKILSRIEKIDKSIENWRVFFTNSLSEVMDKVEDLKTGMDFTKEEKILKEIDLGEISVDK